MRVSSNAHRLRIDRSGLENCAKTPGELDRFSDLTVIPFEFLTNILCLTGAHGTTMRFFDAAFSLPFWHNRRFLKGSKIRLVFPTFYVSVENNALKTPTDRRGRFIPFSKEANQHSCPDYNNFVCNVSTILFTMN